MRVPIDHDPYAATDRDKPWNKRGIWPCRWIGCPGAQAPFVAAFARRFTVEQPETVRIHVTADERYHLYLDGERIGQGSERGDKNNWFFETYDLVLTPGEHILTARVWALGEQAPYAQMSVRPGLLLSPQEPEWREKIGTGVTLWWARALPGYRFRDPLTAWGTGANIEILADPLLETFVKGPNKEWKPADLLEYGSTERRNDRPQTPLLRPATLLPQVEQRWRQGIVRHVEPIESIFQTHKIPIVAAHHLTEEVEQWQALLEGTGTVTLTPDKGRRVLIDLQNYVCAYPEFSVPAGRGIVRIHWQEALYEDLARNIKGNREEIEGKFFGCVWKVCDGVGDFFYADAACQRQYDTLWWQAGRFVEIVASSVAAESLTIESLQFRETRYPLEPESRFAADDPRIEPITKISVRALQMCAHETYMDCPHFEQIMYIGDTRLQALCTYVLTRDDRLPRKALEMFDASRFRNGLTQSRYPTRVDQIIPPFSLWWVAMVHDYALWRGDEGFVRERMPGVRAVVDFFLSHLNEAGLLTSPHGWNVTDWVPEWPNGEPPGAQPGEISGLLNWQLIYTLERVADLEDWLGEPQLATRARETRNTLFESATRVFWDDTRGLMADDTSHTYFSEHTNCLALLCRWSHTERRERIASGLLTAPDLARTTIYFSHYLFETLTELGRPDIILQRLYLWDNLVKLGLKTTVEMPEPTRSDCHAWGAHPLFHFYASLLGIRPTSFGFDTILVAPQFGSLTRLEGTLVHPAGEIVVTMRREGNRVTGTVRLPEKREGAFHYGDHVFTLKSGDNKIDLSDTHPG